MAGVTLVLSFARVKSPMAIFKDVRAPSRPRCRRDCVAIVEACGGHERTVRRTGCRENPVAYTSAADERPS